MGPGERDTHPDHIVDVLVLGAVGIARDAEMVNAPSAVARAMLGALALAGPAGLTDAALFDLVWGTRAAGTKESAVKVAVHRLRKWLGDATGGTVTLTRTTSGYALRLTAGSVDANQFTDLVGEAAGQQPPARAELLGRALALWRGPALADVPADNTDTAAVARLEQQRVTASVDAGHALVATGRPEAAVSILTEPVQGHPLDERLIGVWIRALAATGRQADALDAYEQLRLRLRDELGADPSRELSHTLTSILRQDLPERATAADEQAPAGHRVVPAQLPTAGTFTGRDGPLEWLDALLGGRTAPTAVITGTGGVGKTALAVHWAHRAIDAFPGGQLYADLRGFSTVPPARPIEVLGAFLRALGVSGDRVPTDDGEASALFRSLVADRRVLVVLDNAADPEQVRPLLPGAATCLAVVTSRDRLDGLVALDGAMRLQLDVLHPAESRDLLSRLLGADRIDAEPQAAADLADACVHLPLALRIAAAQLTGRRPIAGHLRRLHDSALETLALPGDSRAAVRAVFDLSYQRLNHDQQYLFALFGTAPVTDITPPAAAALTGTTRRDAETTLDALAAAHLLHEREPGRYTCHDLLRAYADGRAHTDATAQQRTTALHRLCDWYTSSAREAAATTHPGSIRLPLPPQSQRAEPATVSFATEAAALGWLSAEHGNLLTVIERAAGHGPHAHAWVIADALRFHLQFRCTAGYHLAVMTAARSAAEAEEDQRGVAVAQLGLGQAAAVAGDLATAFEHHGRARELAEASGWLEGEAAALNALAAVRHYAGDLDAAVQYQHAAIDAYTRAGAEYVAATCLGNLGGLYLDQGRLAEGARYLAESLDAQERLGATGELATGLANLGEALLGLGQFSRARETLERSIELSAATDQPYIEFVAQSNLAHVEREVGNLTAARPHTRRSGELARRLDQDLNAAVQLLNVARDLLGDRRFAESRDAFAQAVQIIQPFDHAWEEISALTGLAGACRALGRLDEAHGHAQRALAFAHEQNFIVLECQVLIELAATQLARGKPTWAAGHAERAAGIAELTGHRPGEARARRILGDVAAGVGRPADARGHWRRSAEIFTELGMPEAAELRALVATGDRHVEKSA